MNILQLQKSSQSPHSNTQNYICHDSQDHSSETGTKAKREKVKVNGNTTIISQHYLNRQWTWGTENQLHIL